MAIIGLNRRDLKVIVENTLSELCVREGLLSEAEETKSSIIYNYFNTYGTKETPRVIAAKLAAQGYDITSANVSVCLFRYNKKKYLSGEISSPIETARKWFYENGGDSLSKDNDNYAPEICRFASELIELFNSSGRNLLVNNKLMVDDDDTPFYDLIQIVRFKEGFNYDIKDHYLLYFASLYFKKASLPSGINGGLGHSLRYLGQNPDLYGKKGNDKTDNICRHLIKSVYINPDSEASRENIEALIRAIKSEYSDICYGLNSMCEAVKARGSRINPPKRKETLIDVLHLMLYIISYDSFEQKTIFSSLTKIQPGLELRQPIEIAFETVFRKQNESTYNEAKKLFANCRIVRLGRLFDPCSLYPLSNNELYEVLGWLVKNYNELPSLELNQEVGIVLEEILTAASDCNFLVNTVPSSKYGGDDVFNLKNLINPSFTAVEAIRTIGESTFPKAKKRIETLYKNGEQKELSFFELVRADNKIKEKTQRDIYLFLISNSNVKWIYEYNNTKSGKQTDKTLGQKSIDMMCSANGTTYCVEYQGEQHFRPLSVKPSEENFAGALSIRDRILTIFDRILGESNSANEAKNKAKEMILNQLLSYQTNDENFAELKTWLMNLRAKTNNIDDFYKGADRFPNYLLSPKRFLDEIEVYSGKKRDADKISAVHGNGWKMIYILPGSKTINDNDIQYALSLKPDELFRWNREGKGQIIQYLAQNGLKSTNESIIGSIFNELLLS